jgi:hypothetical protein
VILEGHEVVFIHASHYSVAPFLELGDLFDQVYFWIQVQEFKPEFHHLSLHEVLTELSKLSEVIFPNVNH